MHDQAVAFPEFPEQLPHRLDIGQGFDIPHRAPDFSNHNVIIPAVAEQLDALLDLIGDVRDNLDGFPKEFPPAFLFDNTLVDAPRGDVVGLGGTHIQEPFVMPQVQVRLGTVIGHIALPVFIRVERSRIHVDIGVQFLNSGPIAPGLQ